MKNALVKSEIINSCHLLIRSIIIPLLLTGCVNRLVQPTLAPASDYSASLSEISDSNIENLTILADISPGYGEITKILNNFNTSFVYFITNDHQIVTWDLNGNIVENSLDLGVTDRELTNIARNDLLVITPNGIINTTDPFDTLSLNQHTFSGYSVWNLQTGTRVYCIGFNCRDSKASGGIETAGVTLHPSGKWLFDYSGELPLVDRLDGKYTSQEVWINPYEEQNHISKIRVDSSGDRVIAIYEEGFIRVLEFNESLGTIPRSYAEYGDSEGARERIDDFVIDPSGVFAATQINTQIELFRITDYGNKIIAGFTSEKDSIMEFDQSGKLLFIGESKRIRIIDVESGAIIRDIQVVGLTSLSVSLDNRLLFWGDATGNLHVMGVRENP